MSTEDDAKIVVHSQYIKDLSFEGPSNLASLKTHKSQPQVKIGFDVKVENFESASDVSLLFHLEADIEGENVFVLELNYVGNFSLNGVRKDLQEEILFTGCPALLFPFARQIIAHTISNAGFPPVMLEYINFVAFYRNKISLSAQN